MHRDLPAGDARPLDASDLRHARLRPAERGVVFLWTLVAATLVCGVVLAGSVRLRSLQDATRLEFNVEGQARQVAESGLVEALAWLRRQTQQPVTVFAPQRDLTADPVVDDTDDPSVGLVRTFEIGPSLWGQYVVRKGRLAEDFVDQNANGYCDPADRIHDTDGNGIRTMALGMRDTSAFRGGVPGATWHLESEGRVYRRPRADLPLGEGENVRIAHVRLATQVRRLVVTLPGAAALIQSRAEEVDVKKGVLIVSPVQGVGYRSGTGSPKISSGAHVLAPVVHGALPALAANGGWVDAGKRRLSVEEMFGVSLTTLRSMADVSVESAQVQKGWRKQRLAYTIPDGALVVYTPSVKSKRTVVFDKKVPLRGRGIVVIDGDVEFRKGSASSFTGILVVLGKLTVHGSAKFTGTVIVQNRSSLHGNKLDIQLTHDPALVNQMLAELGRYRRFKGTFTPTRPMLDERPNEQFLTERRPGGLLYDGSTPMASAGP